MRYPLKYVSQFSFLEGKEKDMITMNHGVSRPNRERTL